MANTHGLGTQQHNPEGFWAAAANRLAAVG